MLIEVVLLHVKFVAVAQNLAIRLRRQHHLASEIRLSCAEIAQGGSQLDFDTQPMVVFRCSKRSSCIRSFTLWKVLFLPYV